MPPPTQAEIDTALDTYRGALATLHTLSHKRDVLVRAPTPRLPLVVTINSQIAAQRNVVKAQRAALRTLLTTPGAPMF